MHSEYSEWSDPIHVKCPEHAYCDAQGTGASKKDIVSYEGYWRLDMDGTTEFIQCRSRVACLGWPATNHSGCATKLGYKGTLCHRCAKGFSRSGADGCKRCPELTVLLYLFTVLILFAMIMYLVRRVFKSRKKSYAKARRREVEMFKVLLNGFYGFGACAALPLSFPMPCSLSLVQGANCRPSQQSCSLLNALSGTLRVPRACFRFIYLLNSHR